MNKFLKGAAVAALATFAMAGTASAATYVEDFESVAVANGSFGNFAQVGQWFAVTPGPLIEVQDHAAGNPAANGGQQFAELDSTANAGMYYDFTAAGTYTLSFLFSNRPGVNSPSNNISVYLNDVLLNPPGTVGSSGGGATSWTLFSSNAFQAVSGDRLKFLAEGPGESYGGYLDNVTISAVPEPATWAMMIAGFGLAGTAIRRRRHTFVAA